MYNLVICAFYLSSLRHILVLWDAVCRCLQFLVGYSGANKRHKSTQIYKKNYSHYDCHCCWFFLYVCNIKRLSASNSLLCFSFNSLKSFFIFALFFVFEKTSRCLLGILILFSRVNFTIPIRDNKGGRRLSTAVQFSN